MLIDTRPRSGRPSGCAVAHQGAGGAAGATGKSQTFHRHRSSGGDRHRTGRAEEHHAPGASVPGRHGEDATRGHGHGGVVTHPDHLRPAAAAARVVVRQHRAQKQRVAGDRIDGACLVSARRRPGHLDEEHFLAGREACPRGDRDAGRATHGVGRESRGHVIEEDGLAGGHVESTVCARAGDQRVAGPPARRRLARSGSRPGREAPRVRSPLVGERPLREGRPAGDGTCSVDHDVLVSLSTGSAYLYQGASTPSCINGQAFAADVDSDGAAELVCNSGGSIKVRDWNGTAFGPEEQWPDYSCSTGLSLGDFDGDGQVDVLCDKQRAAVGGIPGARADLMASASNGFGGSADVSGTHDCASLADLRSWAYNRTGKQRTSWQGPAK